MLAGCTSASGGSSGGGSDGAAVTSPSQAAIQVAVRAAASLDRRYPKAHQTTTNETSIRTAGVSYSAAAIADGWDIAVVLRHGQIFWVVVRQGHGTLIGRGSLPKYATADDLLAISTSAITDCRYYPCKPDDLIGCKTCSEFAGAPVRLTGEGVDFQLRSPHFPLADILFYVPPGTYTVSGGRFQGMKAGPPQSVRLTWKGQKPSPLFVTYR